MFKRIMTTVVAAAVCVSAFAGCGGDTVSSDIAGTYGKGEISYPIQTNGEELEYFVAHSTTLAKQNADLNDINFRKELEKRTGIKVKYITPSSAQWSDQFNLLFSSDDLPDMIYGDWRNYAGGGADGVIDDGFILDLTPYLEDYAPNYWKVLNSNDEYIRSAKSPKGRFYNFGAISHDVRCYGPYLRGDWLKELNLEIPETIDEWETVLTAFKEKKGASAPLAFGWSKFYNMRVFESAFNTSYTMYVDDNGKIAYGPVTSNWKDYLMKMRDWVEKGLLDRNVATNENDAFTSYILSGETGAGVGYLASAIGSLMNAASADPSFELVGAPYPVLNKGDQPKRYGGTESHFADKMAIAANSPNKELAMRFLDYAYSEEGDLFFNYGTEGLSYEMVDGKPKYTDLILKNPDGRSIAEALSLYTHADTGGPFQMHDESYLAQIVMPQQIGCTEAWVTDDSHTVPGISLTSEERTEYARIMTAIENYVGEITLGYICGQKSEADVDAMPAKLKEMGIEKAVKIYQDALDRYNG